MRAEEERKARIEEDRKIAAEILERKKREEEEMKKQKKEVEEWKVREMENVKKQSLEDKKRSLLCKLQPKTDCSLIEKPKKKPPNNPFAQKFELLADNAKKEEKALEELHKRKLKTTTKLHGKLYKSKQKLLKLSKDNINKSQDIFKKLSKQSLRRSCSKDQHKKRSSESLQGKENNSTSKKEMQNYLISQVLFDGKEDVHTSKVCFNKDQTRGENSFQEQDRLKRELEVKKKVREELASIKQLENEQKIKNEEAKFEAYKKDMEKYLDFVCEGDKKTKLKSKKQQIKANGAQKLKLNIQGIKNHFEEIKQEDLNSSPNSQYVPLKVNKIDTSKLFPTSPDADFVPQQAKTYIPVIIDKAAFERTVHLFEKEKKDEQERKINEEKIKKRREEMETEKQRLIAEKNRKKQEEINKTFENHDMQENCAVNVNSEEIFCSKFELENQEKKVPLTVNCKIKEDIIDIHERIRMELEKLKKEEEKQQEQILKDRKKKELIKQIQEELNKIRETSDSKESDDTPQWIKMVTNPSLRKQKEKPMELNYTEIKERSHKEEQTSDNYDIQPPKWIQIFQEKSKKIEQLKKDFFQKKQSNFLTTDDRNNSEPLDKFKEVKEKNCDNSCDKSLECLKSPAEPRSLKEESVLDNRKSFPIENKVQKAKSMLFIRETNKDEEDKNTVQVKKHKASAIKELFESKLPSVKPKKPLEKQPKKKIVTVPEKQTEDINRTKENKKWKWKEKDSKDLYVYINSNKKYVPEVLLTKAKEGLEKQFSQSEDEIFHQQALFDDYISKIENYIEQETKNETETIFKETLVAYLDLIDDQPRRTEQNVDKFSRSNLMSLSNASVIRDKFENVSDSKNIKPHSELRPQGIQNLLNNFYPLS
jgi:hypothetical protein